MSLTMFVQRQNTTKIWHGVGIWFLWFKEYHFGDREIIKSCLGTLIDVVSLDGDDWWWWQHYSNSNSISSRLCTLGLFLMQRQEEPFPGPCCDPLKPILLPMAQSPYGPKFPHLECVPGLHIQEIDESWC